MKHWFLAAVILLVGSVAPAWADYVVIIIDLAKQPEATTQPGMEPGPMQPRGPMGGPGFPPGRGPMGGPGIRPSGPMGGPYPPSQPQPGNNDPAVVDFDAVPMYLTVVVEVQPIAANLGALFEKGQPISVSGKWGKATLANKLGVDQEIQVELIPNYDKSSLNATFTDLKDKAHIREGDSKGPKVEKAEPLAVLTYADWCLKHGYLRSFAEAMDQFSHDEPKHPAAVAYVNVTRNLNEDVKDPDPAKNPARAALVKGYKWVTPVTDLESPYYSPHYIAYHKETANQPPAVMTRLRDLERSFKSFYYWYALRGIALPVPKERQVVVVTFSEKEHKQFKEQVTASMEVADGFVARREGLVVLSAKRFDTPYVMLEKKANEFWSKGINRDGLLKNPDTAFPKDVQYARDPFARATLEGLALLQTVSENDGERASVTHNGSRQLLYTSGLLPNTVAAPEWLLFGTGSFFETPAGSPYVSTALPSSEYLPLWGDLKKFKQLGSKQQPNDLAETLRLVVTDSYFRQAQQDGNLSSLQKARATSWALMYFLAGYNKLGDGDKTNLEGLQRYFREMARMPRDRELDEKALLNAFCKAFNLLETGYESDPSKSPKFQDFARKWDTYLMQEKPELHTTVELIRKVTKKYDSQTDSDKLKVSDASQEPQYGGPFHPAAPADSSASQPGTRPGEVGPHPPNKGPGGGQPYPPGKGTQPYPQPGRSGNN